MGNGRKTHVQHRDADDNGVDDATRRYNRPTQDVLVMKLDDRKKDEAERKLFWRSGVAFFVWQLADWQAQLAAGEPHG